jgi:hypothetical protein
MSNSVRHFFSFFRKKGFDKQNRKDSSKGYTLFIYIIKREQERETPEDLKQAFRVFDKVSIFSKPITYDNAF